MASGSVVASMVGAGGMTVAKFAAAAASGSSGMFAEGVRSAVNCGNAALLALGQRRSRRRADTLHPFGYGMEAYFWTLIVGTVLFTVAGVGAVVKGVLRVLDPQPLGNVGWSYAVLGLAAVLAGRACGKAWAEFRSGCGGHSVRVGVKKCKDPVTLTVLLDSAASLVGLAVAFLGLLLSRLLNAPVLDGVASVLVGLLMAAVAVGLVVQSQQLLIGESATAELKSAVRDRLGRDAAVAGVDDLLTMHLSPRDVLAVARVRFRGGLSGDELAEAAGRLAEAVRAAHPELTRVFVEPVRPAAGARGPAETVAA